MHRHGLIAAGLTLTLAVGCGGSKPKTRYPSAATAAGVSTATGTGTGTTAVGLEVTATPLAASQAVQRILGQPIVALAFDLEALNGQIQILRIDLTSTGSVDESTLGGAELIEDLNGNGRVDAGETAVASAPAAMTDDGPYLLLPASPLVLVPGTTRSFLAVIDATGATTSAQAAAVGDTIVLSVLDAGAVAAQDDQGNPPPIGSAFPVSDTVTLELNDTVMLSEVCTGPGTGSSTAEFVELFNATAQPVDLSNYYLTDMTDDPSRGRFYWKLPTGNNFTSSTSDWIVRFPAGTQILPGEILTVAIDGMGFSGAYTTPAGASPVSASFCLRNPGTTAAVQMLTWDGVAGGTNFVPVAASGSAGLTGPGSSTTATGEMVCLFTWDGTADLVVDVDLINYGNQTFTNTSVNKSPNQGANAPDVKVDSLTDSDAIESTFQDDSSDLFQLDHRAPNGASITRMDFLEGAEVKTGGNGLTGNDETSEDFGDGAGGNGTFQSLTTATPGQI